MLHQGFWCSPRLEAWRVSDPGDGCAHLPCCADHPFLAGWVASHLASLPHVPRAPPETCHPVSSLQGLGQLVSESYLVFQVLDLSLWVVDVFIWTRKLLRGHPLAPGGGCIQQLLTQAGQFILQVYDHGVFVLGFEFKIRETGDFFSQQQNYFILQGGQAGSSLGVRLWARRSPSKHAHEEGCHSFWKARAGGGEGEAGVQGSLCHLENLMETRVRLK